MISYLIDGALVATLAFTGWRTGTMYRELRHLRSAGSSFRKMLEESDASINRAAHAVVMLKSEGVKTLRALERESIEARALADRLEDLLLDIELRAAMAQEASQSPTDSIEARPVAQRRAVELAPALQDEIASLLSPVTAMAQAPAETRVEMRNAASRLAAPVAEAARTSDSNWLSRIESRLASASAANR